MEGILAFIVGATVGAVSGFMVHAFTMKVSFKQRTIDNKIKVYDALIGKWVEMRNFIYTHYSGNPSNDVPPQVVHQFDLMYGVSQQLIGEAILICEEAELAAEINRLNELLYRTEWHGLPWETVNETMEAIKKDAMSLIARMREDIKDSTRFEWRDFMHIASGFKTTPRR